MAFCRIACIATLAGACGTTPAGRQCLSMGTPSPVVTGAAVLRLDVYSAGVQCDGIAAAANSPSPVLSRSFTSGQSVSLDGVPPGHHTVVLTSFSDAAASAELGGV